MSGVCLATKGMICGVRRISPQGGGGIGGVIHRDRIPEKYKKIEMLQTSLDNMSVELKNILEEHFKIVAELITMPFPKSSQ